MKFLSVYVLVLMTTLAGCASHPDKIQTAYVSPMKYQEYSCKQIALEMDYVGQRTTTLYQKLKNKRTADNWQMGAGMVLFWPALFALEGGDGPEAAHYAQLKGEFEALRETSVQKECGVLAKSPEDVMKEQTDMDRVSAREVVDNSEARHLKEVKELAVAMECAEAVSLQQASLESETWGLLCGNGESLTVRCFDGDCYVRKLGE